MFVRFMFNYATVGHLSVGATLLRLVLLEFVYLSAKAWSYCQSSVELLVVVVVQ